jgi:hypothetical protein
MPPVGSKEPRDPYWHVFLVAECGDLELEFANFQLILTAKMVMVLAPRVRAT